MEPSEGVRERGAPAARMGREREVEATLWAALGAAVRCAFDPLGLFNPGRLS